MEIKIALDMEIAAYSKLLQGEETRLGLSASGSPEQVAAPPRGVKRKRTIVEEEEVFDMVSEHAGPGNVVIEPLKKGAKFIRIFNKSFDDLNIGGWTMSNEADGQETSYKFHRSTVLKPGDMCTVYSADSGEVSIANTGLFFLSFKLLNLKPLKKYLCFSCPSRLTFIAVVYRTRATITRS